MNKNVSLKLNEIFGISRDLPLNYTTRRQVDDSLIDSLTRDKHVVIYGSSKQGKTSLRKHCLTEKDYIVVQCSNKWSLADLHAAILKQAGYEVTQAATKTTTGRNRILAKLSTLVPILGLEISGEDETQKSESVTRMPLELDPEDVNDIILALQNFDRFIVLEDFHYLSIEAQKDFAVALKAFHEKSKLCFIVIGVWLEEGRLTVYNGDLTGRIVGVNADKWTREELKQVMSAGEKLLNISFADTFRESLLSACFDSVYILQEACYKCCQEHGIYHSQESHITIGQDADANIYVRSVVNEQSGRYHSFILQFAAGFQDTALQMYKWLLLPVLTATTQQLEHGLRLAEVRRILQANHPSGVELNVGNITQALQSAASLQVNKDIKPIILDYDQTNLKLNVVDRGFLIWLQNQNVDDLLEVAGLPKLAHLKSSPNPYQPLLGFI